ncbi:MAG: outer-membrane lipoprotein carrier protein LolA [Sulfurovaceae bacterium]|nr:outer-membrane lipoprotein carrier protein LolA [Sulfurovaceae bacterium]
MKKLLLILACTLAINSDISLPDNFITDFNQTITNDKGKVIKYIGQVSFKQDIQIVISQSGAEQKFVSKLFKWDYKKPTHKEVCSDAMQIIVIDHDLEQVSKYIIDDGLDLEKVLKVAQKLSTKDYKAVYKDVEYLITLNNKGELEKIFYTDSLDNRVRIIFNNMNYNSKSFKNELLECDAPSDYDIIEG